MWIKLECLTFKMHWLAMMMCLYVRLANARTEEDQQISTVEEMPSLSATPSFSSCFYRQAEECPDLNKDASVCPCKRIEHSNTSGSNAVLCCNVDKSTLDYGLSCAEFNSSNTKFIHIRNATFNTFNVSEVRWRMLESLAVTDGKINQLVGQFLIKTPMCCLNFSNNALTEVANKSLTLLTKLTTLDLSYNNLTHLPALNVMNGRFWLDISGTNTLWCHDINQYINKTSDITFNRENETVCSASKTWHWFNTTEQVPLQQVLYLSLLQTECPKDKTWQCKCNVNRLDIVEGRPPTFAVYVDCSGIHLTELPKKLPPNTIALNVSSNNITILDDLSTNVHYKNLREFYADNNNIVSINKLEGSKFLDNYAMLSLRHNKINSLPTYILKNNRDSGILSTSTQMVKLGGNKLQCDCTTAKSVKPWLQRRILDSEEVMCENMEEKVVDLDPSKMCVHPGDWTDYIYYIIGAEVMILVGLIVKVSYDYYVLKTKGYLPWPANRMPKLPCDWLCEKFTK